MEDNSIKKKAFASVFWKFSERIMAQLVSLVVSIVLARILSPDDYSTVGLVTIFFTFANVLISGGLNTALIQKKEVDSIDYSTVLLVSMLLSVMIYSVLFSIAPLIANFYKQPVLIPMIRVMGLALPINALKSIWCAYISTNLLFRKFFFATIGGTLVSAIIGITMACNNFGAWSLVAQQMTNIVIDTIILIVSTKIQFTYKVSLERLKKLWKFGWKVFISSIIGTLYTQITPLVTGIKYSKSDLSYYTKGRSFPELLSTTSTNTLAAVLLPVMSKYQDDKQSLLKYTRLYIRLASYVAFPLMLGMFAIADNFVNVVLTEKWLPAVPFIRIFCLSYMFDMVGIGNCETIKAMGKSGTFLIMEVIKKTCYFIIIALFVLLSNSAQMLAISYIFCTVVALIVNSVPNKKLIGYNYILQFKDLIPNLLSSVFMCFSVYIVGLLNINKIILLIIQVIMGGVVYIILGIISKNQSYTYFKNTVLSLINRKRI